MHLYRVLSRGLLQEMARPTSLKTVEQATDKINGQPLENRVIPQDQDLDHWSSFLENKTPYVYMYMKSSIKTVVTCLLHSVTKISNNNQRKTLDVT